MQETTLEVTHLDGTTTTEEAYEAAVRELGHGHSVASEAMVSVRMTYGAMQTALLKLPAQAAKKAELVERTSTRSHKAYQMLQMLAIWPHLQEMFLGDRQM